LFEKSSRWHDTQDSSMPSLREARLQALLSIRQLARRAGIAPTTIYLLETHQRTPQLLTIYKLSRALDVDPIDIDEFRDAFETDADPTNDEEITP
jgi:transcriptional regulator with XRE-family HTH domain